MKRVADVTIGYREIAGTEFPVENVVYRNEKRWIVLYSLCNGVAASSTSHRSLSAALKAAGVR
jgi:hypothetical protein